MKIKNLLTALLTSALVVGAMTVSAMADNFEISDVTALQAFASAVNEGNDYAGDTVTLTADIDLKDVDEWTPIGTGSRNSASYTGKAFKGTFDGNGKTISNLTIVDDQSGDAVCGFFGIVSGGTVKNLNFVNASITSNATNTAVAVGLACDGATISGITVGTKKDASVVYSPDGAAGVLGRLCGSGTITGCVNYADVISTSTGGGVGGVIGKAYRPDSADSMEVENCVNYGDVECGYAAGGIVGLSATNVIGCENYGTVTAGAEAGGIVGEQNNPTTAALYITGNKNEGEVTVTDPRKFGAGGIIGQAKTQATNPAVILYINDNENGGDILVEGTSTDANKTDAGGIVGYLYMTDAIVTGNANYAENIVAAGYAGGIVGLVYQHIDGNITGDDVTIVNNVNSTNGVDAVGSSNSANHEISNNEAAAWSTVVTSGGVETKYNTLAYAVEMSKDGDTITLLNDVTFEDVLLYEERNSKTWNGSYAFDIRVTKDITLDLAGYTIKSIGGSDIQHYAIICVDGKGNLTITDSSAEKTGAIVNATTSRPAGKMSVVLYSEAGDITLEGGTYSNQARVDGNYPYVIDSITAGDASLVINDGVKLVSDGYMTLRAMSQGGSGTQNVTINGGEFEGGVWVVLKNGGNDVMNFTVSDGTFNATNALIIENYAAPADGSTADTVSITGGTFNGKVGIGENNVGGLLADGFISGGIYVNDVSEYTTADFSAVEQYEGKYVIIDEDLKVEAIEVKLVEVTENVPEGEKLYNINLVATDDDIINRLNSADLTFILSNTTGKTEFEIIASNEEVVVAPVNNSTTRYEFHYNGKDGVKTDVANTITIGQVKFTGYGVFTFAVDTEANDTNAAHATKLFDNLVDTFVPDGDTANVSEGELVIDNSVINAEILVPTRDLVINIDFPNAINDNEAAYQDMTVTVSGADLEADLVVELGENGEITPMDTYVTKTSVNKAVTAVFADGAYKVTVTDLLNVNTAYTVTVEGAGYRTARYTVTMTEDKTLNFWNNVKDNAFEVEEDKASSAKTVTFLAGDIVKDGNINIYDLSAVVSYFGEIDLDEDNKSEYAKYDLNRDGKIDSKDVAYVLVSWGN